MKKIIDKFYDQIIKITITKLICLFTLITGITMASIIKYAPLFLKKKYIFSYAELVVFVFVFLLILLLLGIIIKKIISKQKFIKGTKVTLSTGTVPIMSVGRYDFLRNKVSCSWADGKEIKERWINQDQLIEYNPPKNIITRPEESPFWKGRNHY